VAVVIHISRLLRDEMDAMPADEAGNPALGDRALSHI
jgi:hypothetical protein